MNIMNRTTRTRIAMILSLLLLAGAETMSGQTRLIHYSTEDAVVLRWIDPDPAGAEGYNLYRMDEGYAWEKLNSELLTRVTSESEIEEIAGYKTDLYLGLIGAKTPRDLTEADYQAAFRSEDAPLLRILLLVHPEFGELMGELYYDNAFDPGVRVRYRVERVSGGRGETFVESEMMQTGVAEEIPRAAGLIGEPGDRSATVTWERDQADLEEGRVIAWNVYRADSPLGPFLQINTMSLTPFEVVGDPDAKSEGRGSYVDEWLENGTAYYYQVRSVNPFGYESDPSETIEVIPNGGEPERPVGLSVRMSGDHLLLSWSVRPTRPTGIEIFGREDQADEFERLFLSPPLEHEEEIASWVDMNVEEGKTYHYYLRTIGENYLRSESSDTVTYTYDDTTPPSAPTGLTAVGEPDGIKVAWAKNPESDVVGYEVERSSNAGYLNRTLLNGAMIEGLTWEDNVASNVETTFGYVVYALDRNFNRSKPSAMVYAAMPDIVAPQQPIITRLEAGNDTVELAWTASPDRDLASWTIYRADDDGPFKKIGSPLGQSVSFRDIPPSNGRYRYAVSAVDSTGNESPRSLESVIEIRVEQVLPAPANFNVEEKENHLLLSWSPVPGAAGYTLVHVDRESGREVLLEEPDAATTIYRDEREERLNPGDYIVRAHDEAWVVGQPAVVVVVFGRGDE